MIALNERRHTVNAVAAIFILGTLNACDQSSGSTTPVPVLPETFAVRSIDGSGNNTQSPFMGAAGTKLIRQVASDYADDVSQMAGPNRTNARTISNIVHQRPAADQRNSVRASDFVWQWGQFVDHDIDLTTGAEPVEAAFIPIPMGDPDFDPTGSGAKFMENPRQQLNMITTWIDASNVYGSDAIRAEALRTNDGTGKLKTSDGDLLPFNVDGLPNAGSTDPDMFLAGDIRANEQAALTSMHTLFDCWRPDAGNNLQRVPSCPPRPRRNCAIFGIRPDRGRIHLQCILDRALPIWP
jgi:hypothetical protein